MQLNVAAPAHAGPMMAIAGDPVRTSEGRVAGTRLAAGVKAYLGIPYAKPPTGDLRWRAPQPVAWQGVWNADRMGPECIQLLRRHDINHYFGEEPTSEDCLYLNVWVPAHAHRGEHLPVVVFIYGGGGTIGSAGMAHYDGAAVARHGAIFVSMNYRVGLLGFMAHPALSAEQGGHSGNYGYLDQNAALRWVHTNIAAFGGDPARVLLAGQSFGAGSVAAQIASPMSKSLFRAALMSSGCDFARTLAPLSTAEAVGLEAQHRLGVADLAELRNAPADRILALQAESQNLNAVAGVSARPLIDGQFLPASFDRLIASHAGSAVPVIANFNADDNDASAYPLSRAHSVAEFRALAKQAYGANADAFLALFPTASDADVPAVAHQAASEQGYMAKARGCAIINATVNHQPTYADLFAQRHSYRPGTVIADQDTATVGAYHNADIPFWFGTLDAFNRLRPTRDWTPADRALSERMMTTLVAFAATGHPTMPGVVWPAATADAPRYLRITDATTTVETMNTARMDWLAAHPAAAVVDTAPPALHAHD